MKRIWREHAPYLVSFGGLFIYFLWPLLLLKKSFVLGDYGVQFYPWSFFYSQFLKQGQLPYWTDLLSGGFPLVSEGQFGPYYLLHQLLYRILPFEGAYTWGIALHFLLGGTGLYLYARKIGLSSWAGALTGILFTFSSAYGGCFYNIVTQRALTWVSWALWVMECLRDAKDKNSRVRWTLLLAVLMSQMWTGGFPQMALYGVGYLGLLTIFVKEARARLFWSWAAASVLAVCLALPQLASTVELAQISVRSGESADFALWGSAPPFSLVSLVYPEWGNLLRVTFYIGILPLFFFLFELFSKQKKAVSKGYLWLTLVFILLAFGKYNPLYAAFVKTFSLTALRNPSKFLFFATVSMAVLAGFGMDRWWLKDGKECRRIVLSAASGMLLLPLAAWAFLKVTAGYWEKKIPSMAAAIHAGKTDPSKTVEAYAAMLREALVRAITIFSRDNGHEWAAILFILVAAGFLLMRGRGQKPLALALVSLNLIAFAHFFGTGFLGNIARTGFSERAPESEQVKALLPEGTSVAERVALRDDEWFEPSKNLFYDLPHAGGYSPLLVKRHYELTRELGIVDGSLGRLPFSEDVWKKEKALVDSLGIGLILSESPFENPGWRFASNVGGRSAYQNLTPLPLVYGVSRQKVIPDRAERLRYLKSEAFAPREEVVVEESVLLTEGNGYAAPGKIERVLNGMSTSLRMAEDGVLVSRITDIPGIQITIDGKPAPRFRVNHAFCGARLSKGPHEVRLFYDPSQARFWEGISLILWIAVLTLFLLLLRPTRPSI